MSVLIKGMKMPKDNPVTINIYRDGSWVNAYTRENGKAIEVPPHGDLIDRMALLESIKEARKKDPDVEDVYIDDYFIVAEWLMSAPAIIKEDGGT